MARMPRARWAIALMWVPALPVLLPVFTAIHVSDDPRQLILSDRWVYPSALGAGAMWGLLAEAAWTRSPKTMVRGLLAVLAVVGFGANALAACGESSSFHDEAARQRWVAEALRERGSLAPVDEEYVWGADAMDAERRGEWPRATDLYRRLLGRRPSDYSRRFNLARALLVGGQRDEGLYQAYLTFEGRTPEGRRLPVNDSFFRHRSERAVLLASAFESRGDPANARHYYESALRLDPSNRIARSRLASLR
jgi:tetratricopeptide (TPR) repeat protein